MIRQHFFVIILLVFSVNLFSMEHPSKRHKFTHIDSLNYVKNYGNLIVLPYEIIVYIINKLPLQDRASISCLSQDFFAISFPLLYGEVRLEPNEEEKEDLPLNYILARKINNFINIANCPCGYLWSLSKNKRQLRINLDDDKIIYRPCIDNNCGCKWPFQCHDNVIAEKKINNMHVYLYANYDGSDCKLNLKILDNNNYEENMNILTADYNSYFIGQLNIDNNQIKYSFYDANYVLEGIFYLIVNLKDKTKLIKDISYVGDADNMFYYDNNLYVATHFDDRICIHGIDNNCEIVIENKYKIMPTSYRCLGNDLYIYLMNEHHHGIIIFNFKQEKFEQVLLAFSAEGIVIEDKDQQTSTPYDMLVPCLKNELSSKEKLFIGNPCDQEYLIDFVGGVNTKGESILFIKTADIWYVIMKHK